MNKLVQLAVEMFVVGVGLAIISLPVSYAQDFVHGRKIDYWPKYVWGMLIGTAISGGVFHFLFEVTGLNEYYVKNYKRLL